MTCSTCLHFREEHCRKYQLDRFWGGNRIFYFVQGKVVYQQPEPDHPDDGSDTDCVGYEQVTPIERISTVAKPFVVNAKKHENGYRFAFGKGNYKLFGICGKDAEGKWGVIVEASGDVITQGEATQRECKQAFYNWAVAAYKGCLTADQPPPTAVGGSQPVAGVNPDGTPMHEWQDVSPDTGMNEAERKTSRLSFQILYAFAAEYGPHYFQNDPDGLRCLQEAAADVHRLVLSDK